MLCFGPQAHSPFKEKGSAISLALGVNGLAQSLLMAFAGCAFSMRSFQNYIPMKLYFTEDVKLDLCKSIGTKTQGSEQGRNEDGDKQLFRRRRRQKEKTVVKGFCIENWYTVSIPRESRLPLRPWKGRRDVCCPSCLPPPGTVGSPSYVVLS